MPRGTVQTTRARPGLGAVQLIAEEDTSIGDEARVWTVSVSERGAIHIDDVPVLWRRDDERWVPASGVTDQSDDRVRPVAPSYR